MFACANNPDSARNSSNIAMSNKGIIAWTFILMWFHIGIAFRFITGRLMVIYSLVRLVKWYFQRKIAGG
jgi:hypothetical protein